MGKFKEKINKENLKNIRPSLMLTIVFGLIAIYFLGHIIAYYFNSGDTLSRLEGIKEQEVVGTVVAEPEHTEPQRTFPFLPVDFTALKERNDDTVAWLKVGAVEVDIPIVQTTDNKYYLDRDIDKKQNALGWVFADARSNMEYLGTNTVLYGHNNANRQMFGSLKEIFNTDPEKKEQNEIIQLTTPRSQMVFEITSVYVTTYEDWKYVQQDFAGEEAKRAFIDRMQDKNEMLIFERNDLSVHDNFLTFSTCYGPAGTPNRLVMHARLIAEIPNE